MYPSIKQDAQALLKELDFVAREILPSEAGLPLTNESDAARLREVVYMWLLRHEVSINYDTPHEAPHA